MSQAVLQPVALRRPQLALANRPVVAQVLHRLSPAGAEVLAAALARELSDRYRFVFFCLDAVDSLGHELVDEGFDVRSLNRRPGVDWQVVRQLRRATAELGVDILHAHQYAPFFYAAASRGLTDGPRLVFTEHGRHYPDQRRTKRVIANKLLLRKNDRITAVGHFIRDALIANEGLPADRIDVIHNGVEASRFGMPADQAGYVRAQVRQSLGLHVHTPVVLQVARFHPVKDHATAIRAFACTLSQCPDAVLLLAGDGEKRSDTQALVASLGIEKQVRFLGLRHDIPRLMAAADVFMLSSLSEGLSVTMLEAMGSGLPIVATKVGGNAEVVADGETGLLAPRSDYETLATHLINLLGDPARRRHMGALGQSRLHAQFTQADMHDAFDTLYRSLILD